MGTLHQLTLHINLETSVVHLRRKVRLHSGMQALPDRDNIHLEVIDLDGTVRKWSAFMEERGDRRKFRLYSYRFFSLGQRALLGLEVLFILWCRFLTCEKWHETDQLFHTSQQNSIISKYFHLHQASTRFELVIWWYRFPSLMPALCIILSTSLNFLF